MTTAELDQLVAQIGDEILTRLKDRPGAKCPACEREFAPKPMPKPLVVPVPATNAEIARLIDHTVLKPETTATDIERVCQEAAAYGFWSVCVSPAWVPLAAHLLSVAKVKVCTVVGFPHGAMVTEAKRLEAAIAIRCGATEIDMVQNVGALRSGDAARVRADIRGVAEVVHNGGALLKVIIETSLLNQEEKKLACELAQQAGADFVKTSTGFNGGGATVEDIALMRAVVGPVMGVKASGGVRTLDDVKRMVAAGATRIGASSGVAIIQGLTGAAGY
jgi:deoxyribose-phosphate aldolase